MGQEVGVTPLQLIAAVSAIANGGLLYKPHVVAECGAATRSCRWKGRWRRQSRRRVIRPETAATLRRLMEGVVLHGTGKRRDLDGWTAAGKTGTAQKIDPATGRYSPTQLIASFTGFAPINNPAVTILVSLDSPVGLSTKAEQVAAPVFKRIAEQVLPYLDVPRDVPLESAAGPGRVQDSERGSDRCVAGGFHAGGFFGQPDQPRGEHAAADKAKDSEQQTPDSDGGSG